MRPREVNEARKLGMCYEHAKRVENYCRSMLSGPLRVDQIAKVVELEVSGDDTAHMSMQRCA